jgi:hypothetical protein
MSVSGLHDFAKDFLFKKRKYTVEAVCSVKETSRTQTSLYRLYLKDFVRKDV